MLNLVHVLEVCYDYQRAFKFFKSFMRENKNVTLTSTPEKTLSCAEILEVIADIDNIDEYAASKIYHEENRSVDEKDIAYEDVPMNPPKNASGQGLEGEENLDVLNADQLDLLAFYCTLIKVVYLVGALDLIPKLVERIGNAQ